jgi:hypothetical protein
VLGKRCVNQALADLFAAVTPIQAYFFRCGVNSKFMAENPKNSPNRLKTALWAALWNTVLTIFIAFALQANNRCFLVVNGAGWMWTISALMWF